MPFGSTPDRKILPHATPAWVGPGSVFFITVCCHPRGHNHLCRDDVAARIFDSVAFRHSRHHWFVHLMVLMPDHVHALISFPAAYGMARVVQSWKGLTAKSLGIQWQRDFFDHRLRSDESYNEKAHYVRMNPVRKGLDDRPEDWRYKWEPK